jgi:hypothetical protein
VPDYQILDFSELKGESLEFSELKMNKGFPELKIESKLRV